jgi:poly-gamma-glutamate synthesis protein (capsule biosynthesis protein)
MAPAAGPSPFTLCLAGDVMTGRGVDQALPTPSKPELHESFVKNAADYVAFAESVHGPVQRRMPPAALWGDALPLLAQVKPAATIVNLETSVTVSDDVWPGKGINYRMHPANVGCLQAAHLDVCALANNHVLDYGRAGLLETLDVLHRAGIRTAGAGRNLDEARQPARVVLADGTALLVLAFGCESSGIPAEWAAGPSRPGVWLFHDLSNRAADAVVAQLRAARRPGDVAVASIHWGSNWGYEIDPDQVAFAHRLVEGGIGIVHGHSSHHVRPVEVYEDKLILYGCGDLVNDYEGIPGHEEWRGDLGALYFVAATPPNGALASLQLAAMHMRRMRLERPMPADAQLLAEILTRISRPFGLRFTLSHAGLIALERSNAAAPR